MQQPHEFEQFYDDELKELLRAYNAGELTQTDEIHTEVQSRQLLAQLFMARHSAGLTQDGLAKKTNLPQSTVARIELAGSNPKLKTLVKLADALGHELILRRRSS